MPVSNKHSNTQRVFYAGFDGGLNLSVPNESLPKNELKEAVNVEFSPLTGSMKVRGGLVWSGRFDTNILFIVPVHGRRGFLARAAGSLNMYYFRWNNIWPVAGTLSVGFEMSIAHWVEIDTTWGYEQKIDCWLVASGGNLHKFVDTPVPQLTTIANAPANCKLVFVRENRVGVVTTDDKIMFSALGDCENWTNDPADESSAQYLDEIGYKDGMKINAVVPLSKDLIIFKSPEGEPDKGIIYRLTGEYPDWAVVEAAHNTGTFSQQSVCALSNDIVYATVGGVSTLSTVTNYGEVKTAWPDRKVSNALTYELDSTAKVYDVPVKQQVWIAPSENSNKIWVFDYARGIWTTFEFPKKITYAAGVDNRLFVFIGQDVYEVNDSYTQDELRDEGKKTITAKMRLGTLLNGMQTLVKAAFASFELMPECKAELRLGKWKMPFAFGGTVDFIYGDPSDMNSNYYQWASEDDDPLIPQGGALTSRRKWRLCSINDRTRHSGGVDMPTLVGPFNVGFPVNFISGGDTTNRAFSKHIQEIERIYGYLNALDAGKVSASDVSGLSGSIGNINTALTNHINSTNPHPNYKPSWSDLTGTKPNLADFNGNLPMSRITGNLDASRITNLPSSSGITDSNFASNGYVKFGNGMIINWGRLTITPSDFASKQEGDYPITFAEPFTSACYVITVSTEINTTDNVHAEVVFQTKGKTITGCNVVPQVFYGSTSGFANWNSISANYIAIGK